MIKDIKTNELALFLGKTKGWASNLKKGRKKLPLADCFRVSEHFGIPLSELRSEFPANKSAPTFLENNHGTD
jgi:hypothetical protein